MNDALLLFQFSKSKGVFAQESPICVISYEKYSHKFAGIKDGRG